MRVHERGDWKPNIEWSVEHQQCEITLLARANDDYCAVGCAITVEVSARNIRMIVRNWFLTPDTRPHSLDIFTTRAVLIVGKPIARMITQPCGDLAFLLGTQSVAGGSARTPQRAGGGQGRAHQE